MASTDRQIFWQIGWRQSTIVHYYYTFPCDRHIYGSDRNLSLRLVKRMTFRSIEVLIFARSHYKQAQCDCYPRCNGKTLNVLNSIHSFLLQFKELYFVQFYLLQHVWEEEITPPPSPIFHMSRLSRDTFKIQQGRRKKSQSSTNSTSASNSYFPTSNAFPNTQTVTFPLPMHFPILKQLLSHFQRISQYSNSYFPNSNAFPNIHHQSSSHSFYTIFDKISWRWKL
jgi:hypothetical protein